MENKQTIMDEVAEENSLLVPEEPADDEDSISEYSAVCNPERERTTSEESPNSVKSVGFSSIVTAIRVAKWMAKAYGYSSKCKSQFTSQDIQDKRVNWTTDYIVFFCFYCILRTIDFFA